MRKISLALAQLGSVVMVLACIAFAVWSLVSGDVWKALLVGIGGSLYWTAMFHVFGAVEDYLDEKATRSLPLESSSTAPELTSAAGGETIRLFLEQYGPPIGYRRPDEEPPSF